MCWDGIPQHSVAKHYANSFCSHIVKRRRRMNAVAVILLALANDRRNSGNLSPSLHIFSSSQLGSICGRCQRQGGEKTRSLCTYALRTLVGPALPPLSPLNDRNQPFHSEVLMPGNRSPQDLALINGFYTSWLMKSKKETKDNLMHFRKQGKVKKQT